MGIPMPMITQPMSVSTSAGRIMPPEMLTMSPENLRPRPVSSTTPTTTPAIAQGTATGTVMRPAFSSASIIFSGPMRVDLRTQLSTTTPRAAEVADHIKVKPATM